MARSLLTCALVLAGLAAAPAALAATYEVGPGKSYADLGAVASLLNPGDVVLVDGDATYPPARFTRSGTEAAKITIRGVRVAGKRPVVSGGTNTIEAAGDHYVFEGLEITGGSARCFFHHAHDVTLRDSVVHDCPKQGILGADQDSGSMLLEYVEVYRCGGGTFDHQIYMATDESTHPGAVFRMQFCYVHDANGGNSVKSRAERNEIYYNWIEGALYHELELIGPDPAGGVPAGLRREDSDVVGNVLRKTGDGPFVRIGGDGTGESKGRYRFVSNTFLGVSEANTVFRIFDGIESVEMHGNAIYRVGGGGLRITRTVEADWVAGERIAGSNNWIPSGSTYVPTQWTGTITGTAPGFVDVEAHDLRPASTSPLVDRGPTSTSSPEGSPFPAPLERALFHPPARTLLAPGTARPRPMVGVIDVGAFEYGEATAGDAGATDSGTGADSGTGTGTDAGSGSEDAGSGSEAVSSTEGDDGCGCRAAGVRGARTTGWSGVSVAIASLAARRRAARRWRRDVAPRTEEE